MTVYVIMGNDYPEAVFSLYSDAAAFIAEKQKANVELRINWRSYSFNLNEQCK